MKWRLDYLLQIVFFPELCIDNAVGIRFSLSLGLVVKKKFLLQGSQNIIEDPEHNFVVISLEIKRFSTFDGWQWLLRLRFGASRGAIIFTIGLATVFVTKRRNLLKQRASIPSSASDYIQLGSYKFVVFHLLYSIPLDHAAIRVYCSPHCQPGTALRVYSYTK